jgi:hypothetical protein
MFSKLKTNHKSFCFWLNNPLAGKVQKCLFIVLIPNKICSSRVGVQSESRVVVYCCVISFSHIYPHSLLAPEVDFMYGPSCADSKILFEEVCLSASASNAHININISRHPSRFHCISKDCKERRVISVKVFFVFDIVCICVSSTVA